MSPPEEDEQPFHSTNMASSSSSWGQENPFLLLSSSSSLYNTNSTPHASTSNRDDTTASALAAADTDTLVSALTKAFQPCLISSAASHDGSVTNMPKDDNDIDLDALLEACRLFQTNMHVVGQHGNARDLGQNIAKVQQARQAIPASVGKFATVQSLLQYEKEHVGVRLHDNGTLRNPSAAMGLLWMRRAVAFQYEFHLLLVRQPDMNTVDAALQAYRQTLEPFHSWPLQQVFTLAFRTMTPNRTQSLAALWGNGVSKLNGAQEAIVLAQLETLAGIWEPLLKVWKEIFESLDLEDPSRA